MAMQVSPALFRLNPHHERISLVIAQVGVIDYVVIGGSHGLPGRPAKLEGAQQFDCLHLATGAAPFDAGRQHLVGADGNV